MDILMMENRLKDIMEREKVTAYRLSKDLGLDKGHLSKVLNGKASFSVERLEQIADYLGYDLQLVKRKRPRKESESWDVFTGEERHTGSSITGMGSNTRSQRAATRRKLPRGC